MQLEELRGRTSVALLLSFIHRLMNSTNDLAESDLCACSIPYVVRVHICVRVPLFVNVLPNVLPMYRMHSTELFI